jgi:hypothetical protein
MAGFGGYVYGGGPWGGAYPPVVTTTSDDAVIYGADNLLVTGGDPFYIIGLQDYNTPYEDYFASGPLSTNWSSGGSSSIDNGITLSVAAPGGSTSYIRTTDLYKNFDVNVDFDYDDAIDDLFPIITISHLRIRARIDANNYADFEQIWDPELGRAVRFSVTTDATTSIVYRQALRSSSRTLRLIRLYGTLYAYCGATLLYKFNGWRTNDVLIELATSAPVGLARDLNTTIYSYVPKVMVEFDGYLAESIQLVANRRLVGLAPAVRLPGDYTVVVHLIDSTINLGTRIAHYIAIRQLTISSPTSSSTIIINNDNTVRDTSDTLKGTRL